MGYQIGFTGSLGLPCGLCQLVNIVCKFSEAWFKVLILLMLVCYYINRINGCPT